MKTPEEVMAELGAEFHGVRYLHNGGVITRGTKSGKTIRVFIDDQGSAEIIGSAQRKRLGRRDQNSSRKPQKEGELT